MIDDTEDDSAARLLFHMGVLGGPRAAAAETVAALGGVPEPELGAEQEPEPTDGDRMEPEAESEQGAMSEVKVFRMSDFEQDSTALHYAELISKIKLSMERGDTIFLMDTARVHGSFYDLFNQNYKILTDEDGTQLLYSNVAIGAATHQCRVHKDFQCIVHMRKKDFLCAPAPFLSRFEKFNLSVTVRSPVFGPRD